MVSSSVSRIPKQCLVVMFGLGGSCLIPLWPVANNLKASDVARHHGFKDFTLGEPGNSGANLYVSRKGHVQVINTWDLNGDGHNDVLISNDHNPLETVDALIYWGSDDGYTSLLPDLWSERPLAQVVFRLMDQQKFMTRLPSFGGGKSIIADLNGDGFPEIVFCNYIHNYPGLRTAYVYWGSREGFSPSKKTELPTHWAAGVAAADLNGDGYPDLVFANQGVEEGLSDISPDTGLESFIYWGSATGFDPQRRTLIQTRGAKDVTVADFNKDGHPDLAFINNGPSARDMQILWGGSGGYSNERTQTLAVPDPTSIRSSDINGDGFADLIVTTGGKAESIALLESGGKGKGNVSHAVYLFFGSAQGLDLQETTQLPTYEARDSAIGDFDHDGLVDIAIANSSDGSSQAISSFVYWGSEQGFLTKRRSELPTLGAAGVAAADLNRDGYVDLIFANSNSGTTQDIPSYIYWGSKEGFAPYLRSDLQSFGAASVNAADLNGDGKTDIVLVNQVSGKVSSRVNTLIYWGNPHHYYSTALMTGVPGDGTYGTTAADLNDDGFPDVLVCNAYTNVSYLYWGSKEGFSLARRQELRVGAAYTSHTADLNRDGYLDLVFTGTDKGKNLGTILWGATKGFSDGNKTILLLKTKRSISNLIADLNRDGFLDLVFPEHYFGTNQIFWGGPEGYSEARSWTKFLSAGSLKLADLNGDGFLDFVIAGNFDSHRKSYNTRTRIFWGTAEGTPSSDGVVELEAYGSLECGIADLNRDGFLDLTLSNYMSDSTRSLPLFIYWGSKGGYYSYANRTFLPAESSAGVQTVDLNRDGYPDIVIHNHLKDGDHSIDSYIYWNSSKGFDRNHRTKLPTFGPHFSQGIDPGNLYTRKLEEEYVSAPIANSFWDRPHKLDWKGEEPHGAKLKFQVRSADTRDKLSQVKWLGPNGPDSFYEAPGSKLSGLNRQDRFLQYRAVFTSPDAGVWPILGEVVVTPHSGNGS